MTKTYYYARVSTKGQNLDRQIDAFLAMGADERDIITDKETGKTFDRPGYQSLKQTLLRDGDTLVVKSLDRLGRNKNGIYAELQDLRSRHIRLKVLDIPTTMVDFESMGTVSSEWVFDMVNNILIEVYASIAQQELECRATRQAEGISAMEVGADGKKYSKRTGRAQGRPTFEHPEHWDEVVSAYRAGKMSAKDAVETLGIPRATFYKHIDD